VAYYTETRSRFSPEYLVELRKRIHQTPYLAPNNLTTDFVGARGFSVVFKRSSMDQVKARFEWMAPYMDALLDPDSNAFYFNPLLLVASSRVDPHIDRSLRAYCRTVEPPRYVSVLYVTLPEAMSGGQLVLSHGKREVGRVTPEVNKVVRFQGDLLHHVTPLGPEARGERLSVICEQYDLPEALLAMIPDLGLESRGKRY
jgi:hypothetical protein